MTALRRRLADWPPGYFLGAALIALVTHWIWPVPIIPDTLWAEFIGGALVAAGIALLTWSVHACRKAATSVNRNRAPTTLVATGPLRLSRNPIYLADALMTAGVGIAYGTVWILPSLAVAMLLLDRRVVQAEEASLARLFPHAYSKSREHVRRWL